MTRWLGLILAGLFVALAASANAHPALSTVVTVRVDNAPDGPWVEAIVTHDALAFALNDTSTRVTDPLMYALLEGPREDLSAALQDGRERFESGFVIVIDDAPLALTLIDSPTVEDVDHWKIDAPSLPLPLKLEFITRGRLPTNATSLRIRAPGVFDQVMLSVAVSGRETQYIPLAPGELSPAFDVSSIATDTADQPASSTTPPSPPGFFAVAWRYIVLGFHHIVPEGHDHELFILGLFLLNTRFRDVLWQTTAFTIAHTCTLSLATLGLVAAPPAIVEPIIAASIAFIAIENLLTKRVHPWRPAVAFLFGLVHGMGFAAGLREIGLPASQLATALIAFNIGVEAGHLLILAAAYATLGWWRTREWFRPRLAIPISALIAAIAIFWLIQRVA